jgi:hypothetical protein
VAIHPVRRLSPLSHPGNTRQRKFPVSRQRRRWIPAPKMIVVEMGNDRIIDVGRLARRSDRKDITHDPFIRPARAVGTYRRIAFGSGPGIGRVQLPRIEQHRRPVRQDKKGGIAATGVDMMQVQIALPPGGQRLTDDRDGTGHRPRRDGRLGRPAEDAEQ